MRAERTDVFWPVARAAGYTGSTKSLLLAMTVASGCNSCIQAGQDVSLANNTACIAVAAPKEIGSQSTAPKITSNAVFGVRCRHFRNTHAMPLSKAMYTACSNAQ